MEVYRCRPIESVQKSPVVSPCRERLLKTRVRSGGSPRHRETRRFRAGTQSAVNTDTGKTMASRAACSPRKPTVQSRKSSCVNSCYSTDNNSSCRRSKSIIIAVTNKHNRNNGSGSNSRQSSKTQQRHR